MSSFSGTRRETTRTRRVRIRTGVELGVGFYMGVDAEMGKGVETEMEKGKEMEMEMEVSMGTGDGDGDKDEDEDGDSNFRSRSDLDREPRHDAGSQEHEPFSTTFSFSTHAQSLLSLDTVLQPWSWSGLSSSRLIMKFETLFYGVAWVGSHEYVVLCGIYVELDAGRNRYHYTAEK